MLQFTEGGWFFPDGEAHLQEWMLKMQQRRGDRLLYQGHKYERAMKWVKQRRLAIDVGAHVGLWSWQMAQDFEHLTAFEPMVAHRECWLSNMNGAKNMDLISAAVGAEPGIVRLKTRTPGSSGDTGVDPVAERSSLRASVDSDGEAAQLVRLDDFGFTSVDFIKIDVEGYELYVLQGARELLERERPCLIVEQKPETGMEARYGLKPQHVFDFLEALGAKRRASVQGDHVYSWD
jgi:FkbM family methyltransferase